MSNNNQTLDDKLFSRRVIDIAIKLTALAGILVCCFQIIHPFIMIVLWGAIIAVALYPLHTKLTVFFKGKKSWASIFIAVVGITMISLPSINLASSSIDSAKHIYSGISEGSLTIPTPTESVKEWPVVGGQIYSLWQSASEDVQKVATQHADQIKELSRTLVSGAASLVGGLLQSLVSLIIAVVFMANAESCHKGVRALMNRLMNDNGERTITTAVASIKSVATGVLGIAFVQSLASGLGLLVAGIPGAGLWAIAVLMLAIAQLPPIIVLGPIAAYYFSVADTTPAVLFLIFSIVVSTSDAFLKPLFLGRGMDIPMPVILLGAIGGMIMSGVIGLFVGAVVLALGYELMMDWLSQDKKTTNDVAE